MKDPPTIEEMEKILGNIWENNKEHNKEAPWIQHQKEENEGLMDQRWLDISLRKTSLAIKRNRNRKAQVKMESPISG